jgi:hypothetical protein
LTKLATIAKVTVTCLEIIIKELIEEWKLTTKNSIISLQNNVDIHSKFKV